MVGTNPTDNPAARVSLSRDLKSEIVWMRAGEANEIAIQ